MTKRKDFLIKMDSLIPVDGAAHIYVTDVDNNILLLNDTARRFFETMVAMDRNAVSLKDIFATNTEAADLVKAENKLVMDTERAQLFYNHVNLAHASWIDLLTIKMPIYNVDGEIAGVFGVSFYAEISSSLPAYQMGLTKREIDCVFMTLEGLSAKEIANALKISHRTVEFYLENAKAKLACETKSDLLQKLKDIKLKTRANEMITIKSVNLANNQILKNIKATSTKKIKK